MQPRAIVNHDYIRVQHTILRLQRSGRFPLVLASRTVNQNNSRPLSVSSGTLQCRRDIGVDVWSRTIPSIDENLN